jgi:hypothetical protein
MISSPMPLMSERNQRVYARLRADQNASAVATVTAAWTTARYVLLATECHATVTTSPRDNLYLNSINKHTSFFVGLKNETFENAPRLLQQRLQPQRM